MSQEKRMPVTDIGDVIKILVERWKLIIAIAILFAVAGAILGIASPTKYSASAALTVAPLTMSPFSASAPQTVNMATEREVMVSREVAGIASEALGDTTPGALIREMSVSAPAGSQVLKVISEHHDAEKAATRANALADAYLAFRATGAEEIAQGQIGLLNQQMADLTARKTMSDGDMEVLASLQEQVTALQLVGENPGRVISRATVPTDPVSPGISVFLTASLALGLLVGFGIALSGNRGGGGRNLQPSVQARDGQRMPARKHRRAEAELLHDSGRAAGADPTLDLGQRSPAMGGSL